MMYDFWAASLVRKVVLAHGSGRPKASERYLNLCRTALTIAEKIEALVEAVVNRMVWTILRL